MLDDIAVLTAARPSRTTRLKLENLTLAELGRAKRITVTKDDTTLIEGAARRARSRRA